MMCPLQSTRLTHHRHSSSATILPTKKETEMEMETSRDDQHVTESSTSGVVAFSQPAATAENNFRVNSSIADCWNPTNSTGMFQMETEISGFDQRNTRRFDGSGGHKLSGVNDRRRAMARSCDKGRVAGYPTGFSMIRVLAIVLSVLALVDGVRAQENGSGDSNLPWNPRKGCHKVGHRRTINIPGCDRVEVLLNGCRGQCLSWAVPSPESIVTSPKFRHKVTSYSHCCRMTEHEEVTYLIRCEEGIREIRFPSALKCDCFDCTHHAL